MGHPYYDRYGTFREAMLFVNICDKYSEQEERKAG